MAISELQISLIALGSLGVVGVWAYNKWQEQRHRRSAEQAFRGTQADVLGDAGRQSAEQNEPSSRIEPVLATDHEPDSAAAQVKIEPQFEPPPNPPTDMLDGLIESVGRMDIAVAVPARKLLDAQRLLAGRLSKPLRWSGLGDDGQWSTIDASSTGAYRRLHAGLLLANREGAVSDTDLQEFVQGSAELAESLAATNVDLPDPSEELERARLLDNICAALDIQIAVHVVHRDGQSLAVAQVQGLAEAAGLRRADALSFRMEEAGIALFTLTNLGEIPFSGAGADALTTHGMTFWLDVPRVAEAASVFEQMIATARQFAASVDGVLVDDHRSPLSDAMLVGIRGKVDEIQQKMVAQDIPPGGARALRLFA